MTEEAFENAIRVLMAIGGSTNAILHLQAIASELDIELELELFDNISRDTPWICPLNPNGPYTLQDLEEAGGIPAVMQRLRRKLHLNVLTVTGETLGENIKGIKVGRPEVIKPVSKPEFKEGGIAVLKGNLAPRGAIVRQIGVDPKMLTHEGPAKVFNREEDATEAVLQGKIQPGDVIVIRYEGPKGGPGMREMHYTASAICADPGLASSTALVTDGRFSGGTRGPCIGFVSPEAAEGGPIAIVEDGDIIQIDIPRRKLNIKISDEEIRERLAKWKPMEPKVRRGFLAIYAQLASSADRGAILNCRRNL
jgi:dihydroxy-acid dehydratase